MRLWQELRFAMLVVAALCLAPLRGTEAAAVAFGIAGDHVHNQFTGLVLPVAFSPGAEHYDFALMWSDQQLLDRPEVGGKVGIVARQWVFNGMRRWTFRRERRLQPWLAFGAAWFSSTSCAGNPPLPDAVQAPGEHYAGCNHLLGSQLNFAEQGGLRWVVDPQRNYRLDFSVRHFSNANLTRLNRGQEMVQLMLSVRCQRCGRAR